MVLAFISDIHANLPALEAVWKDIQTHKPDAVYCLGDLVNFAGWDNEVIDFVRQHHILTVQGNHDEGIGNGRLLFSYSAKTEAQKEFGIASITHVHHTITLENCLYLKNLPFSIKMEFRYPFHSVCLVMVHGSPLSSNDYIFPNTDEKQLLELLRKADADILVCGHTHKPFYKRLYTGVANNKLYGYVVNAGSVGKPKHGNNKACYTLITINENLPLTDPTAVEVQFFYVFYNVQEVIDKIHAMGLGNAYDDFLTNGEL